MWNWNRFFISAFSKFIGMLHKVLPNFKIHIYYKICKLKKFQFYFLLLYSYRRNKTKNFLLTRFAAWWIFLPLVRIQVTSDCRFSMQFVSFMASICCCYKLFTIIVRYKHRCIFYFGWLFTVFMFCIWNCRGESENKSQVTRNWYHIASSSSIAL